MEILEDILLKNKKYVEENYDDNCESIIQDVENYLKEATLFLETGNINFLQSGYSRNSEKENVQPNKRKGRLRKPTLVDVAEDDILETRALNIKKEKISGVHKKQDEYNLEVKEEIEEMPAPTRLPPRKKKIKTELLEIPHRLTRSKAKKQENHQAIHDKETKKSKNSDVIIQNTTIPTIEISDSEKDLESDNNENVQIETNMRSTRSKFRQQNKYGAVDDPVSKFVRNESDNEGYKPARSTRTKTKQEKRPRSNSPDQLANKVESKKSKTSTNPENKPEYQDAVSMVVANPKMVTKDTESDKLSDKDLVSNTPPRPTTKSTKQIFSPFEKTPVKKKVEAFEKLGTVSSGIPTKFKGTKKIQNKDPETKKGCLNHEQTKNSFEKDNVKVCTPIASKFIPKVCSTSKLNHLHPFSQNNTTVSNDNLLSVKSASALKASQAEFREREKRRQEKENEALRKREALLQAQTEEKRRKREEKQQKAQQQREIMEKEKLKQLEMQKIKEEKHKQAMVEREVRLLKEKEEAEKRRLIAKKKANELLKEKEEVMRIAEQQKNAEMKALVHKQGEMTKMEIRERNEAKQYPIYMITKPPLLPTDDCYDSDDPEHGRAKKVVQTWARDKQLRETLLTMITIGETIKNTFFCVQAQTPDLQEIFETINPKKLKRTSSAIWRKPPRYTLMRVLEDTLELEFSEDSDE